MRRAFIPKRSSVFEYPPKRPTAEVDNNCFILGRSDILTPAVDIMSMDKLNLILEDKKQCPTGRYT